MCSSVCVISSSKPAFATVADEMGALSAAGGAGSVASEVNDGRTVGASATEGARGAAGGAASAVGSSNIRARSAGSAGGEVFGGAGGAATKTAAADGAGLALSISASVICSTISVTTSSPRNSPRQLAGGQGASEGVSVAGMGVVRGQGGAASAREFGAAKEGSLATVSSQLGALVVPGIVVSVVVLERLAFQWVSSSNAAVATARAATVRAAADMSRVGALEAVAAEV